MIDSRTCDPAELDLLCRAIVSIESPEECMNFLEDVMTIKEIRDISQRLHVAQLLREGRPYSQIKEETSISSATISRVSKCYNYGSDGYRTVLDKILPPAEPAAREKEEGK